MKRYVISETMRYKVTPLAPNVSLVHFLLDDAGRYDRFTTVTEREDGKILHVRGWARPAFGRARTAASMTCTHGRDPRNRAPRPMKLAFYHGPREGWWKLVSALIRWRTRGLFDHVEMIFSDGITASASISHGGIKFIEGKDHPYEHWLIVDVPSRYDAAGARRWFEHHCDAKFDTWGVLGFLLGFTRGDDAHWFCSEACAAALGFAEPWRFDPNTLHAAVQK